VRPRQGPPPRSVEGTLAAARSELSERLRQGCREAAGRFTIEDTARKFVDGVLSL